MKITQLKVPIEHRYLSQWKELLDLLPQTGSYVLNKVRTGCGGTTLFLESDSPVILVSPRSNVLFSKSKQYSKSHIFRRKDETRKTPVLKTELEAYIRNSGLVPTPFGPGLRYIPKILITLDSYKYAAEVLASMKLLDMFTVVVDEFQCIMSDAKFKGQKDLEFLHNLNVSGSVKSICYLSATPIPETYLDVMDDFKGVEYYRLEWDASVLEKANLRTIQYKTDDSTKKICKRVISRFVQDGYFERKLIDGKEVHSKEACFFINDLRAIHSIIKECLKEKLLKPKDVNVLCSLSNKGITDIRALRVGVGELATDRANPKNRPITFCTSASFEGVDFYSRSAMTYIFSDGILDWNKHDLIIDVPQILGRQRLEENPFQRDAVLYYRLNYSPESVVKVKERIESKQKATQEWLDQYNSADPKLKKMLAEGIRGMDKDSRYRDRYVEVVDDHRGGFNVKENYLIRNIELRDWELSRYVYSDSILLVKNLIDNTNINVSSQYSVSYSEDPAYDQFRLDFYGTGNFQDKMRLYSELRESKPELSEVLYRNPFIDFRFHEFYDRLGVDRLKALGYREKELAEELNDSLYKDKIELACRIAFPPGSYKIPEVKERLQSIYTSHGLSIKAKGCDLEKYLPVRKKNLTDASSGKRYEAYCVGAETDDDAPKNL